MEIIEKKVAVKLDPAERDNLLYTIKILEDIHSKFSGHCEKCPFKTRCDYVSDSDCLLYTMTTELRYINNNCD